MLRIICWIPIVLSALAASGRAADIVAGNVTTALGPDFFLDDAATGGGDNNATTFTRDLDGLWTKEANVTLKGLGWASGSTGTSNTTVTVTFTDYGADGVIGTGDDVIVGTVTDNLSFSGASEYVWDFDSDVAFQAASSKLRVRIVSAASIRRKTVSNTATTQADVKLSLAGRAVGGVPPAVTNTANGSGNWDAIQWNTGSGNVTGDLQDGDSAVIGRYRTVTYRGIPATETIAAMSLGESAANGGQGTLNVNSGSLNVTGALNVGINDSANDSFVFANGGTLHIGGNASFGRSAETCDGSLILAGGTVTIVGDLAMGAFEQGGSMLRFHNPGSAPPIAVGGTLILGRCSLDLTFGSEYSHVPGTVTTLVTYSARDGQFANFRNGEEFNCGKNRFRINYDVSSNSITLTALENFPASAARPNIIVLFADDQGYSDLQLNGNAAEAAKYPMPRLQNLADAGARFTDAYVTAGVCHPSRCGLLTGRYQQRYGTDGNLSGPGYNGMAVSQRTVPRRLQSLGYKTFGIGKWHMGDTVEYHPNCRGFDRWYGIWSGGRSYWENSTETGVFQDNMTPRFNDELAKKYVTDRIGDACVGFIDEHLASPSATDPFFIYVSFTAVHAPVDIDSPPAGSPSSPADPRFARLASEFGLTAANYLNSSPIIGGQSQATIDKNRYDLAAMTLALDENIGKVLDKLAAEGLTNNTIVLYTNDNGGAGYSQGFGGNYSYNKPLRGYKGGNMTDGAIRVPAAIQWPGTIPPGQVVSDPVISLDWGSSFVNAAGDAPAQARNGLDGLDLMPRLKNATPLPADRVLTWRASGLDGGGSAIRMGDWKMLITDNTQATTLYNIRSNPAENSDQSGAQPEILAELKRRFAAWESSTIAPFYGSASTVLDPGLERQGISGGYRLKRSASSLAWLSSIFRNPVPLTGDFHYRFLARSTESNLSGSAELACALGDSDTRANLIQAIIDYGQGQLRIVDGKSGASASVALPAPTTGFHEASLDFAAATKTLSFSCNGATVSLALTGTYSPLTHFAVGAAAMEGEITTLVPTDGSSLSESATTTDSLEAETYKINLAFAGMPPLDPVAQRSPDLSGFLPDPSVFVENLGGGLYRAAIPTTPGVSAEFFRFRLDQQ
ncbi:sulfatase-like hydrolase/transferase [Akkermansiaceae bacterium]|nr:sulfatase-like hydrolase/transferase [Akkermansiaceae bacterium]